MSTNPESRTISMPAGDYAIVELFGHTTLVGRIAEVERFGAKMLSIEVIVRDELLPAVLHGGGALYRITPCSSAIAFHRQHRHGYDLPPAIRAIVPPTLLASAEPPPHDDDDHDDDVSDHA